MAKYMLILHDNPAAFAQISPADIQKVIEEYQAWAGRLAQQGKLVGGEKLRDEGGKVMRGSGGKTSIVDGPYAEAKEVVGGYYLIEADGYDRAVDLCRDHPHLKYGAKIEVREIEPM